MHFNHKSHIPLGSEIILNKILFSREKLLFHESVHIFFEFPHLFINPDLVWKQILYFLGYLQLIKTLPSDIPEIDRSVLTSSWEEGSESIWLLKFLSQGILRYSRGSPSSSSDCVNNVRCLHIRKFSVLPLPCLRLIVHIFIFSILLFGLLQGLRLLHLMIFSRCLCLVHTLSSLHLIYIIID